MRRLTLLLFAASCAVQSAPGPQSVQTPPLHPTESSGVATEAHEVSTSVVAPGPTVFEDEGLSAVPDDLAPFVEVFLDCFPRLILTDRLSDQELAPRLAPKALPPPFVAAAAFSLPGEEVDEGHLLLFGSSAAGVFLLSSRERVATQHVEVYLGSFGDENDPTTWVVDIVTGDAECPVIAVTFDAVPTQDVIDLLVRGIELVPRQ